MKKIKIPGPPASMSSAFAIRNAVNWNAGKTVRMEELFSYFVSNPLREGKRYHLDHHQRKK